MVMNEICRRIFFGDANATKDMETPTHQETPITSRAVPPAASRMQSVAAEKDRRKSAWEAAVMFAFACKHVRGGGLLRVKGRLLQLNVHAHMSNAMGSTSWCTNEVSKGIRFYSLHERTFFSYEALGMYTIA